MTASIDKSSAERLNDAVHQESTGDICGFRKQIAICCDRLLASKTDMAMKATKKTRQVGASGTAKDEISDGSASRS